MGDAVRRPLRRALYDLTSTYFESSVEGSAAGCRDKRPDCVQVVVGLVVTPQGFPLAYETMPGNTGEKSPLAEFLAAIESRYGRSERVWIMDRGIPTEETLGGDAPVSYLVADGAGAVVPGAAVARGARRRGGEAAGARRRGVLLARSRARVLKERSMRRRRLRKLWRRLGELREQAPGRDELLMKLGAARKEAGCAWHLVDVRTPEAGEDVSADTFSFTLRRDRLRREGRYLLRSNLTGEDPEKLWRYSMRLTEVEQAFEELKRDLSRCARCSTASTSASRHTCSLPSSATACSSRSRTWPEPMRPA